MQSLSLSLRPERLEDVVGHESVVTAIREHVSKGSIATAWLFSGYPGVGKTTLAKIVAHLIQGDLLPGDEPLLDVRVINAADLNGVDAVRELVQGVYTLPQVGKYKVRILDEAQQLTVQAQNVLLNPIEMKDSRTIWIFTTTDPQKLLPALKSRCLHFALKPMGRQEIAQLASKAAAAIGKIYDDSFVDLMEERGVSSPREILMCFDKWAAGVPLDGLVENAESEPLYADVARALLRGNWAEFTKLAESLKTPDVRALRAVVAAFLKGALLRTGVGAEADAISNCLLGMAQFNAFEDGVAWACTVGVFYRCCVQIQKAKAARG